MSLANRRIDPTNEERAARVQRQHGLNLRDLPHPDGKRVQYVTALDLLKILALVGAFMFATVGAIALIAEPTEFGGNR